MRDLLLLKRIAALSVAGAMTLVGTGCGGDDPSEPASTSSTIAEPSTTAPAETTELTPEAVIANLEAAGYKDVELAPDDFPYHDPCDGFLLTEVWVDNEPDNTLIQGEVQFYETEEDAAAAAPKCAVSGVTKYYARAVDKQVYVVESLKGYTEAQYRLDDLVAAARGE